MRLGKSTPDGLVLPLKREGHDQASLGQGLQEALHVPDLADGRVAPGILAKEDEDGIAVVEQDVPGFGRHAHLDARKGKSQGACLLEAAELAHLDFDCPRFETLDELSRGCVVHEVGCEGVLAEGDADFGSCDCPCHADARQEEDGKPEGRLLEKAARGQGCLPIRAGSSSRGDRSGAFPG